jgi:hypothetical protein
VELLLWLVVPAVLVGYASYANALVVQANFYSRAQKIIQCLLIWLLPLLGAALVHWVFRLHHAEPDKRDRAFTPQREPEVDEMRAFAHRRVDDGNP